MDFEPAKCEICKKNAKRTRIQGWEFYYECDESCGSYWISQKTLEDDLGDGRQSLQQNDRDKLSAILRERESKGLPHPYLYVSEEPQQDHTSRAVPVSIPELLQTWPSGVLQLLDRCFWSLVMAMNKGGDILRPGIPCQRGTRTKLLSLARTETEGVELLKLMQERGWVQLTWREGGGPELVRITPGGWERFEEYERGRDARYNPAFVAMWFGGKPRKGEMNKLYAEGIESACRKAGWDVVRADSREHNEPIMGKVLEAIRKAPFVIAELTDNNAGVFYEAGFALGQGKEVIYCRKTGQEVHFDVSAINQVVWKDNEDLAKRLYDRILETQKEGPFLDRGPERAN